MIRRVSVVRIDPTKKVQTAQIAAGGDVRDDVEVFEPWGLTGVAPDAPADGRGAEGLVLEVNDCPDHPVLLSPVDRRYRPTDVPKGDSCLWDANGQRVHLSPTGVKITAKDGNTVDVDATGGVNLNNDTKVQGTTDALNGFLTAGVPGENGVLTLVVQHPPVPAPVPPVTQLTLNVAGGIVTSVVANPVPWVVVPGDSVLFVWVPTP